MVCTDDLATQTLTLTPNVLDPSIIISPFPVQLLIGQQTASFKIISPRTILLKDYFITWSKTGDTFPVTYAPLRRTRISMVKGTLKRIVNVELFDYLPVNGTSYPLLISTGYSPY
jgi:hypothetical protein